jgi:hypothetical protein
MFHSPLCPLQCAGQTIVIAQKGFNLKYETMENIYLNKYKAKNMEQQSKQIQN